MTTEPDTASGQDPDRPDGTSGHTADAAPDQPGQGPDTAPGQRPDSESAQLATDVEHLIAALTEGRFIDFNLPAGAGAGYGQDTDEMYYVRNAGSSLNTDVHVQTTKTFHNANLLGPGATVNIPLGVTFDRGTGGATYNRIQINIRVLMISL
ncbi:hypothetical protein OG808_14155 [Streptomyces sp. NBC_01761]|uniref:hypothetical protein n=1 Tax=unclassified Streptomyces TaxID=2593676 RepID=UPI002DD7A32C|nr:MULTISPECIES: hypothetical protein [unclassified Streptomyces]WSC53306.1 hypothetical protein OG808_14155 [Streptomyces sp. NBC_01761]